MSLDEILKGNAARWLLIVTGLAMIVGSAGYTLWVSGDTLTTGKPFRNLLEIVLEMLPPDPTVVPRLARPLLETAVMSVMATTLSALLAAPLAFLAARTTTPHPALAVAIRGRLQRDADDPRVDHRDRFRRFGRIRPPARHPGALGLLHRHAGQVLRRGDREGGSRDGEAVASCGGSRLHVIVFGIVPQVFAHAVDYTLYRWEHNFRASTVVGMVGAGGIGFEIVAPAADAISRGLGHASGRLRRGPARRPLRRTDPVASAGTGDLAMKRPRVFVAQWMPSLGLDRLRECCELDVSNSLGPMPRAEFLARASRADALIAFVSDYVDAELVDHATSAPCRRQLRQGVRQHRCVGLHCWRHPGDDQP